MFNPTLHTNKVFREQMKACLNNTFGPDTNKHINKTLMKRDTRVLALVVFYKLGKFQSKENFQSVELCNIYNYLQIRLY